MERSDIWYMLTNSDRYLYHYTRSETLVRHILKSRTLRFSTFSELNDPREYKSFRLNASEWGDDISPRTPDALGDAIKARWKVVCFVSDPVDAVFGSEVDKLGSAALDRMHERGHSRPRMWAQYGEDHAGVCLIFDKASIGRAIDEGAEKAGLKVFPGKVTYQNTPVVGTLGPGPFTISMNDVRRFGVEEAAGRHGFRYWRELFLVKNRDWEAEREFRWLVHGGHEEPFYVAFGDSLVGILLGERFPLRRRNAVANYVRQHDVEVALMGWNNGIPQVNPTILSHRGLSQRTGWC